MPKAPLTERMEKKGAPKSWIAEVRGLHLTIKELRSLNESYLDVIDKLARQVEEMQKAIMRLPLPPDEIGDGPSERVGWMLEENKVLKEIKEAARMYLEYGEPELADELEELLTRDEP